MTFLELLPPERQALRAVCCSVNHADYPAVTHTTLATAGLQVAGLIERIGGRWRATNRGMDIHTNQRIKELTQ